MGVNESLETYTSRVTDGRVEDFPEFEEQCGPRWCGPHDVRFDGPLLEEVCDEDTWSEPVPTSKATVKINELPHPPAKNVVEAERRFNCTPNPKNSSFEE